MAISYSAGTGTVVNSFAMDETCIDQTDQVGNNTVVVSDDIVSAGNGQIGTKYPDYEKRLIIIDLGLSTEQQRMCTLSVAIGTPTVPNSWLLTVHEDWDTNPVITTDTIHVVYDVDDLETGGAGGGIGLSSKTGLYELSNILDVVSGGGLQNSFGQGLEVDDQGSSIGAFVRSGGYFYAGYESGGKPVNGGIFTSYNNSATEPNWRFESGSVGRIYDCLFWAQLVTQKFECISGSDVLFTGSKILSNTDELILYGAKLVDSIIAGRGGATEIVRLEGSGSIDGSRDLIFSNVDHIDSIEDEVGDQIILYDPIFSGVPNYITVRPGKSYPLFNPVWGVTSYTDFTWTGIGGAVVFYNLTSLTVQEADGTKLADTVFVLYEGLLNNDLTIKGETDIDGYYFNGYSMHAYFYDHQLDYDEYIYVLDKWLFTPFAAPIANYVKLEGTRVLVPDPNIVQTVQATALSAGSTITWNEDTNPSELFDFTLGSGTLVDGMIITFAPSGAIGTITGLQSGDSVAGEVHLKDRNATAIANGDTFSRTGGSAGTFSGTYTNDSKQPFSIWADGNDLSMQTVYDYFAALSADTTVILANEIVHRWGRDSQIRVLYKGGNGFYTGRSYLKGIFIANFGAGTIAYFTDDAGNTWVPPIQYSFAFTLSPSITGYEWRIYEVDTKGSLVGAVELAGEEVASADNQSYAYIYSSDKVIAVQIIDDNYEESVTYYDISNANQSVGITLDPESNV